MTDRLIIALTAGREPWRMQAACQGSDPAVFDGITTADVVEALGYCRVCPVTQQCIEWATTDRGFIGVAGGRTWGMSRRKNREAGALSDAVR